jgi:hypothetical protein
MARLIQVTWMCLFLLISGVRALADSQCSTSTPGIGGSPGATASIAYDPSTGTVTIGITGIGNSIPKVERRTTPGGYTNVTAHDGDASAGTFTFVDTYLEGNGTSQVLYKVIVRVDDSCYEVIYRFTPDGVGDPPSASTTVEQVGTTTAVSCP